MAWCTQQARRTIDIDVNIFVGTKKSEAVFLDPAVFKALFNRTKDWADLEAMAEAGSLDVDEVTKVIRHYRGEDERQPKLDQLRAFQK